MPADHAAHRLSVGGPGPADGKYFGDYGADRASAYGDTKPYGYPQGHSQTIPQPYPQADAYPFSCADSRGQSLAFPNGDPFPQPGANGEAYTQTHPHAQTYA